VPALAHFTGLAYHLSCIVLCSTVLAYQNCSLIVVYRQPGRQEHPVSGPSKSFDEPPGSAAAPAGQSALAPARPGARGVRQPDVDRAADAILARGERPTIEKVRQLLGTGSPNTVTPLLDAWYKALGARVAGLQASGSQDRAPSAVASAFKLFWDTAMAEARAAADRELAGEREKLQGAQGELAEQQRVLQATRSALEEGMRLAQEQAAELNGVLQERTTKLAQAEAQVRQLAKSLEEAQAATSAAHASAREQLTQQTRIHEEERRIAGERAATNERRLNAEVDRARQDAKAAREDAAQAIALAKRECEREAQATRKASARAEQLQVVCEQLRAEVTRAEQATARADASVREAGRAKAAARDLLALAQARIQDLTTSLASERQAAVSLRDQLTAALQRQRPAPPARRQAP
jgi:hypothetical protein